MRRALELLAALPRTPGRFLLAPVLGGGAWRVGLGEVVRQVDAGAPCDPAQLLAGLPASARGHVVVLGYEAGRSLLRRPARAREDLGLPRAVVVRVAEEAWLAPDGTAAGGDHAITARAARVPALAPGPGAPATASLGAAAHRDAVERLRAYLVAGDAYQANLTSRLSTPLSGPPEALLAALLEPAPPACAAYVDLPGGAAVVSASPELLLSWDAETRSARSEPIKGTRPRGATPAEDDRLAAELAADPKELAEHVMIVDLVRNDLGRVARPGTVRVVGGFEVRRLPRVLHLVSGVEAIVRPAHELPELVASLFPAGSITGAPKVRSMELIDELEPVARGPYCGAIGRIDPDGSCRLSVAIRSAVALDGLAHYGAGGAITVGSDAEREWQELILKAAPFLSAVGAAPPA